MKNLSSFTRNLAFTSIILCLFVILWGAWVRISGSGDGCGDHWPLCHDQIIPKDASRSTWIELTHRITSGAFGLLIVYLYFKARKLSQPVKLWATWSLILTITEALIGAKLVLFGLVGENDSFFRAASMSFHTINSFALMGSLAALYTHLSLDQSLNAVGQKVESRKRAISKTYIAWGALFLFVLLTGSQASLSTTLFPSESLWAGIQADFSSESHWLIRLRVLHPLLATIFTLMTSVWLYRRLEDRMTPLALGLVLGQFVIGIATLLTLSPIWLKLTHLFAAHSLWIVAVFWIISRKNLKVHYESR